MAKIIVLDDSKLMRNLLSHLLEQAGHEVEQWEEVSASEITSRIAASQPNLLITDYQMPGCNGLTVARMARHANPDLPIMVLTATHDPTVMDALSRQDVSCILHKPIQEETLMAAVAEAL